jgi:preprotein translocase subunit SecA
VEGFELEVLRTLGIEQPFNEQEFLELKPEEIAEKLFEITYKAYREKSKNIAERVLPVITDIYENDKRSYENIVIPITDGAKTLQVIANIKRAYKTKGMEVAQAIEKSITLAIIDDAWKEHLREMDDLKQSVQSATYEQKDPLLVYKLESFQLFKKMVEKINEDVATFLVRAKLPVQDADDVKEAKEPQRTDMSSLKTGREDLAGGGQKKQQKQKAQPVRVEKKVGRNEPCPCGSGKKYKHCHGKGK